MQTVAEADEHDDDDDSSNGQEDVITQGLKRTAAAFSTIPATGAEFLDQMTPGAAAGERASNAGTATYQ